MKVVEEFDVKSAAGAVYRVLVLQSSVYAGKPIPRWEAEKRMLDKLEQPAFFLADVHPLLTAEARESFDNTVGRLAFKRVFDDLITRIPGKQWATTPELLTKHNVA